MSCRRHFTKLFFFCLCCVEYTTFNKFPLCSNRNLSVIDKYYCTWKGNNSVKIVNQCLYWEREKKCYCLRCQQFESGFFCAAAAAIYFLSEFAAPPQYFWRFVRISSYLRIFQYQFMISLVHMFINISFCIYRSTSSAIIFVIDTLAAWKARCLSTWSSTSGKAAPRARAASPVTPTTTPTGPTQTPPHTRTEHPHLMW